MASIDRTDIQLGFQYIYEAKQGVVNARACLDVVEAKIGKIEVVMKSIQQQNENAQSSDHTEQGS